jgi:dipeptidyl aminopeptidase/acylaminoacyl peptidase
MPDTQAVQPDDIYRLALIGDARVSPDGRRIAYVCKRLDSDKNDYVSHIELWEDGESRAYTAGEKDSAPRWSPDGRTLAFLSGREGKSQIFLLPSNGGEPRRLTDAKLGAGTPVWSPDGRWIAYAGPVSCFPDEEEGDDKPAPTHVIDRAVFKLDGTGLIDRRRTHLFVIDVASGESTQLIDGDVNEGAPVWSPDGTHIAFASDRDPEWDLRAGSDIWIIPREGGTPRRVTDGQGVWNDPVFSPDGSQLAISGYPDPNGDPSGFYSRLWVISRGGGEPRDILDGTDLSPGDSVSADWSTAGPGNSVWTDDGLYFLASDRGDTKLYRWSGDALQAVTDGQRHIMDFTMASGVAAATISDLTHPAEIYRGDVVSGGEVSLERVTHHNDEYLENTRVVAPERVEFAGADGDEVDGWLMKPASFEEGKRYPLILYMHGGPHVAYGDSFFHEFQALAGAGFGVFYCNPHGSTTHGRRFQTIIIGDWGNRDYADILAAADYVAALPWVDEHRIGIAGGSYAGFMTNWVISHTDRFAAAVTERSICNHLSQGGTSDWAATRGQRLGGTPEANPDILWDRSPLKYAANVHTPTLIMHSERDDRCPIEQGEQWFMALKRLRVPTRFIRFPEESHGLSRGGKPSRRVERLNYIIGWFRERM